MVGLDAISMTISGKCPNAIEQRVEKRNKQGRLYLEVDRTKQKDTFNVILILPSIIRPSNLEGFSLLDSVNLGYVIMVIKSDLQEILGMQDFKKLIVKRIEVNASKSVSPKVDADVITAFVSRALLKTDKQQIEHCHGKGVLGTRTVKTKVLDGFKSARDTSCRYQCKFYRKDRQLGLENTINPTIRLELLYNARGIKQALGVQGVVTLIDLLKRSAIQKLIQRYVMDVKQSIMPPIRLYLEDAVDLVLSDLKRGNGAYKTFLKWYDVIQYDYRIFRTALKKFYRIMGNGKQSANVQASRIKARALQDGIIINEGIVKQLEQMFREIHLQEL